MWRLVQNLHEEKDAHVLLLKDISGLVRVTVILSRPSIFFNNNELTATSTTSS